MPRCDSLNLLERRSRKFRTSVDRLTRVVPETPPRIGESRRNRLNDLECLSVDVPLKRLLGDSHFTTISIVERSHDSVGVSAEKAAIDNSFRTKRESVAGLQTVPTH